MPPSDRAVLPDRFFSDLPALAGRRPSAPPGRDWYGTDACGRGATVGIRAGQETSSRVGRGSCAKTSVELCSLCWIAAAQTGRPSPEYAPTFLAAAIMSAVFAQVMTVIGDGGGARARIREKALGTAVRAVGARARVRRPDIGAVSRGRRNTSLIRLCRGGRCGAWRLRAVDAGGDRPGVVADAGRSGGEADRAGAGVVHRHGACLSASLWWDQTGASSTGSRSVESRGA